MEKLFWDNAQKSMKRMKVLTISFKDRWNLESLTSVFFSTTQTQPTSSFVFWLLCVSVPRRPNVILSLSLNCYSELPRSYLALSSPNRNGASTITLSLTPS